MEPLSLGGELKLIDLALFLETSRTLVIADLHLGYEEALNEDGVLVPRNHLQQLKERLKRIFAYLKISSKSKLRKIIINGDLRHRFGLISPHEQKEALQLIALLNEMAENLMIITGNHDGDLKIIADEAGSKLKIKIKKSYKENGFLFMHGDELPKSLSEDVETIIIGHEHPAISLKDKITGRIEIYKCFLQGCFKDKSLLVQPSFNLLVKGNDLTKEKAISPFISEEELEEFAVYPVSDEGNIYDFGKLAKLL